MRELALTGGDGLDTADADVTAFAADCRFRNCAHRAQPGCAVGAAIECVALDPARLTAWRKLQAEADRPVSPVRRRGHFCGRGGGR
jgi:ribosome biogenesis GTPase